jgi:hypothetical protein
LESRLVLAIEESKPRLLPAENGSGEANSDEFDEESGTEIQPHMAVVEVAAMAAATATSGIVGAPIFDDEGPVWPDESAESAMRAEVAERGETLSSKAAREAAEAAAEEAAEKKNLPELDVLIERIPPEVRDTLEDLFRAKFVKVARTPKKALKA